MPWSQSILNLPWMTIEKMEGVDPVRIQVNYVGEVKCPHCTCERLRKKAPFQRDIRHEGLGDRQVRLVLRGSSIFVWGAACTFANAFPAC